MRVGDFLKKVPHTPQKPLCKRFLYLISLNRNYPKLLRLGLSVVPLNFYNPQFAPLSTVIRLRITVVPFSLGRLWFLQGDVPRQLTVEH